MSRLSGHLGRADDVVHAALYLAADESSWTSAPPSTTCSSPLVADLAQMLPLRALDIGIEYVFY